MREAEVAAELGYDAALLSLAGHDGSNIDALIDHCRSIADVLPLIGFYLQPDVGGIILSREFWRRFAVIERVVAIKIAPFNRYRTLDVVRGVAESGRAGEIALYTGNDDSIVADLVTPFRTMIDGAEQVQSICGGLLGQWACWTQTAAAIQRDCTLAMRAGVVSTELLSRGARLSDCNAAFFDAKNAFHGCIAGIHEVLRRQGLMTSVRCIDPNETLSPGQREEIDRVYDEHGDLADYEFVRSNLDDWLR
jgi:dihydrodipicolinate synthase/N-acetylneuraminate lyase